MRGFATAFAFSGARKQAAKQPMTVAIAASRAAATLSRLSFQYRELWESP
jgi:hypothetical protein